MATIAMLQSAIQISGDGGCRIKLDIDDTGMDAVMALSAMRGELLRVTVELESETRSKQDGKSNGQRRNTSRRTKQKSEGAATE
jgi:hypothetical protein